MTSPNQSVLNFLDYWIGHLDWARLEHLYLIHCGGGFEHLATRISEEIKPPLSCTLLNFVAEPEIVKAIAIEHRNSTNVAACLVYLLDYARVASDYSYRNLIKNLGAFDYWDIERIRLLADVPDTLFDGFFQEPKSKLQELAGRLIQKVQDASTIVVKNDNGTHLVVSVERGAWYSIDGKPSDHILPCGEISTIPITVNGVVSFEGTILGTIPFGFKYGKIRRGNLILEFEDGEVQRVSGNHWKLVQDVRNIFAKLPGLKRIGETSISFNTAIRELAGVGYQWEEKYPGFHFGLGAELSENLTDLSERHCDHHVDFVLEDSSIYADNVPVFRGRQFLL